jgi:hypothetical protein
MAISKGSETGWIAWAKLSGAILIIPAAIAAIGGIKWGVAYISALTVTGLLAVTSVPAVIALQRWPNVESIVCLGVITLIL